MILLSVVVCCQFDYKLYWFPDNKYFEKEEQYEQ